MEEPDRPQSIGLQRVGPDWATSLSLFTFMHWRKCNSLQCSCLENPRDSGAWWAAVYEVAQSRTQLKRLSSNLAVLRQDTLLLYNPCKDQTYSHNLHFKITELARRFNPETVLRQDTLLLYNLKECRGGKKGLSFLPPWEFQTPLSLGTPRLLINLPRKWLSQ